jgi:molybdenum cofactor guanylyltransferase
MTTEAVCGLILAGGQATRMGGGDKPLIEAAGKTLLARVVDRLAPQVDTMLLNANGDPARFAAYGLPVVPDVLDGFGGPLVGVLTGLERLRAAAPGCKRLLTVAADTPLFPADLAERLLAAVAQEGAQLAVARSGDQSHPVFGLWPVDLLDDLRKAVAEEGERKIDAWTGRYRLATVSWPLKPYDPFFNVNTPEDVIRLRLILDGTLPDEPPLKASRPMALVVERRDSANPWKTEDWRIVAAVSDPAPGPDWMELQRGPGFEQYLINGLTLELHRSDLASYRYNLGSGAPRLLVGLRPVEDKAAPYRVVLLTAAPDEAQTLMHGGDDIVEPTAMPQDVADWLEVFCALHPPDQPMRKRRRDKADVAGAFSRKRESYTNPPKD